MNRKWQWTIIVTAGLSLAAIVLGVVNLFKDGGVPVEALPHIELPSGTDYASLRSGPARNAEELHRIPPGRPFYMECWLDARDGSGGTVRWFYGRPKGTEKKGWVLADLVQPQLIVKQCPMKG